MQRKPIALRRAAAITNDFTESPHVSYRIKTITVCEIGASLQRTRRYERFGSSNIWQREIFVRFENILIQ
jgi:hypothetical protein